LLKYVPNTSDLCVGLTIVDRAVHKERFEEESTGRENRSRTVYKRLDNSSELLKNIVWRRTPMARTGSSKTKKRAHRIEKAARRSRSTARAGPPFKQNLEASTCFAGLKTGSEVNKMVVLLTGVCAASAISIGVIEDYLQRQEGVPMRYGRQMREREGHAGKRRESRTALARKSLQAFAMECQRL
jgi:hypothetical protein